VAYSQPARTAARRTRPTVYRVRRRQDRVGLRGGGCLAFFTSVTVGGRGLTAAGVVLGQGESSDTSVLLAAAGQVAEQLVDSVGSASRVRMTAASGAAGGRGPDARGYERPRRLASGRRGAQP
jgi:hypothetical protein